MASCIKLVAHWTRRIAIKIRLNNFCDVIEGCCYSVNIFQTNELATTLPRFVKEWTSHDIPCKLFTLLLQTAMKKHIFYDAELLCGYFLGRGLSGSRIEI